MSNRRLILVLLAVSMTVPLRARDGESASAPSAQPKSEWKWDFNLLPTALQRRPKLDMTFFTEMTEAGRRISPPTAEHPAYYAVHATGSHTFGDSTYETPPPTEAELRDVVRRAFAAAHYQEADGTTPAPTLMIFYHWGVHAGIDPDMADTNPVGILRNLHERASLVGGPDFADRWLKALTHDAVSADMLAFPSIASEASQLGADSETMRRLMAQAGADVYFVVATAYDATAMARKERVLLWRTKMTVATDGVAMRETIAPMIAGSVPYLGRDMPEAQPVRQRIYRDGRVVLGPTEVLGYDFPTTDTPPDAKQSENKEEATTPPVPAATK